MLRSMRPWSGSIGMPGNRRIEPVGAARDGSCAVPQAPLKDTPTIVETTAVLVVFGGLPGVGKTTIARAVAPRLAATYLRIDGIEQAIRRAGILAEDVGAAGYAVAVAIAEANLRLGSNVVADCVNPVKESRLAWRELADRTSARLLEVEIVCSDRGEHRRRVETREAEIAGHVPPSWAEVLAHEYEPWDGRHLVIDTAALTVRDALVKIVESAIQRPTGVR